MLRVGVIGCGGIGIQHATGVVGSEKATVVAGCDLSTGTLDKFKERWADTFTIKPYTNVGEMLSQERLDIVTVATPDDKHADIVVAAAEAGVKGIFCEKPMATTVADADRMLAATEQRGTLLSIDHTRRWMPLWDYLHHELIPSGAIGDLRYLIGTLSGARAILFRNGTHLVDAMVYLADS
ncbi:MAG: Gfo/Idh/MocA family oxidoreductase, partial [Candidatus Poribacteria bacterium]|nr:Gfo/Idh/MocA family oxidoreductase [Candidatus Poribacteria bacterium]